ncbi:MAG: cupin domain-containing protein [Pseudobdellovibrionaceae bacterium]|nr:cupin domain-containing protein [Bdellovibrionales bacterium]USN46749.1 MAG: cupin domain-containing protein [Pseudobdellovibrionaceae bacterium]
MVVFDDIKDGNTVYQLKFALRLWGFDFDSLWGHFAQRYPLAPVLAQYLPDSPEERFLSLVLAENARLSLQPCNSYLPHLKDGFIVKINNLSSTFAQISILFFLVGFSMQTFAGQSKNLFSKCKSVLAAFKERKMKNDSETIIEQLKLQPLPGEGGYFRETYRSSLSVDTPLTSGGPQETRNVSTAIYYLVTPDSFSSLHRLPQDEIFHFYSGDPAEMILIYPDGHHEIKTLGNQIELGETPQVIVPAGVWQATRLKYDSGRYALMGTTVSPGFEFKDMELIEADAARERFDFIPDVIQRFIK